MKTKQDSNQSIKKPFHHQVKFNETIQLLIETKEKNNNNEISCEVKQQTIIIRHSFHFIWLNSIQSNQSIKK